MLVSRTYPKGGLKLMMTTKDINVADLLTYSDRAVISKIVSERVFAEYGDMYEFKWQMSVRGHFQIPETL